MHPQALTTTIPALTLTQPYATLVASGAKQIETRSRKTSYRGKLAIHAGKGLDLVGGERGLMMLGLSKPFGAALLAAGCGNPARLLRGAVIAICDLVDCRAMANTDGALADWVSALSDQERAFGIYAPGRYGWTLANVRALPEPIPARGALGLWRWTPPKGVTL